MHTNKPHCTSTKIRISQKLDGIQQIIHVSISLKRMAVQYHTESYEHENMAIDDEMIGDASGLKILIFN